jgi:hypothetical protein
MIGVGKAIITRKRVLCLTLASEPTAARTSPSNGPDTRAASPQWRNRFFAGAS